MYKAFLGLAKGLFVVALGVAAISVSAQRNLNIGEQAQSGTTTLFAPYGLTVLVVGESNAICYGCTDQKGWSQHMVETNPSFKGRVIGYHNYGQLGSPLADTNGAPISEMSQYNTYAKSICQAATPTHPVWLIQESSLNYYGGNPDDYITQSKAIWTAAHNDGCQVAVTNIRHNVGFIPGDFVNRINATLGRMTTGSTGATFDWILDMYNLTQYDGCATANAAQAVQSACPYNPTAHWADTGHMNDWTRNDEASYGACVFLIGGSCGVTSSYSLVYVPQFTYENDTNTSQANVGANGDGSVGYYHPSGGYVEITKAPTNGVDVSSEQREGWRFTIKNLTPSSVLLYTGPGGGYLEGVTPQPAVGATDNNHVGNLAPAGQPGDSVELFYQGGVFYRLHRDVQFPAYQRSMDKRTADNDDILGADLIDANGHAIGMNIYGAAEVPGHKFSIYNSSTLMQFWKPSGTVYINGLNQVPTGIPNGWREDFVSVDPSGITGATAAYEAQLIPAAPNNDGFLQLTSDGAFLTGLKLKTLDCNGHFFYMEPGQLGDELIIGNSSSTTACSAHADNGGVVTVGTNTPGSGTDGSGNISIAAYKRLVVQWWGTTLGWWGNFTN